TERYRYTEWLRGKAGRELYDHSVDQGEVTNLAENPKYKKLVADLSSQLKPFFQLPKEKRLAPPKKKK
ncbi:iduronate-2-sulfatase, partial [Akkermansiaceae bacterium]|nr:iduronate-2-sulfatase [Akkermansiaceae bacterium]